MFSCTLPGENKARHVLPIGIVFQDGFLGSIHWECFEGNRTPEHVMGKSLAAWRCFMIFLTNPLINVFDVC